ncbi:hypothetical protein ABE425_05520 [Chryseobacterium cucumeris]|uniref:hypothetical protein n=1 Tax=Chryseobacterium cucumeris TaxID=1813611 RepID=UPI00320984D5
MTIKKHNVIKKLDQYACINPITINGEVITAKISGSIGFSALKEIQDSLPGWEVSFTNKNGGAALLIRQKHAQTGHMIDAMDYLFNRVYAVDPDFTTPFPPLMKSGRGFYLNNI